MGNKKSLQVLDIKNLISVSGAHPKILDLLTDLLTKNKLVYYATFSQFISFKETKGLGTCAVNADSNGFNFYWDKKFIDGLKKPEMCFVLIHELFHILFEHNIRGIGYDHKIANIAMDMIINSIIKEDIIDKQPYRNKKIIDFVIDPETKKDNLVYIPKEYNDEWVFEILYNWLKNKHKEWKDKNPDKVANAIKDELISSMQGSGGCGEVSGGEDGMDTEAKDKSGDKDSDNKNELDSEGNPKYGKNGFGNKEMYSLPTIFENLEENKGLTLDQHIIDEVDEDVRKNLSENIINVLKERGLADNDEVVNVLHKLRKKRKDYLSSIKRHLSSQIFGKKKEKTIQRPNRRNIQGLKGKRKYSVEINVILDVSGSMRDEFEKVLSYIFQNDLTMNLIQIDTKIQKIQKITSKKELERLGIQGLGGTVLTPAIEYIAQDKKLNSLNTVILTDGFVDVLNFSRIKGKTLILSTEKTCDIANNSNSVKQIIIDKEN